MHPKNTLLVALSLALSCSGIKQKPDTRIKNLADTNPIPKTIGKEPVVGASRTYEYLPIFTNRLTGAEARVGIVANQTSIIYSNQHQPVHLVDSLLALGVQVRKIFTPEHGFRGVADAGEVVKNTRDEKTGLPILSLYGDNKKPTAEQLKDIDIVVFDLQDVGARFYTYISTLHYVMEACAEQNILLVILDRPNPNGHYVDGPVLEERHRSFVGMHPVPIVHGMTVGEYAQMINGEGWLKNGAVCQITVIPVKNYTHTTPYNVPVGPSPNLTSNKAIELYPSLCLFEGTSVSVGRGTDMPFQVYGAPFLPESAFRFTPAPNVGAKKPLYQGVVCFGEDLRTAPLIDRIHLGWLIKAYKDTADKTRFFNPFFTKLAGTTTLQQQIEAGVPEDSIRESWEKELQHFKKMRERYLLYD